MELLRWILLLIGALLIVGIYWAGRRHERAGRKEGLFERARRGGSAGDPVPSADDDGACAPAEPHLDIDDLDAHGFEVDGRPGEAFTEAGLAGCSAQRSPGAGTVPPADPEPDQATDPGPATTAPPPREAAPARAPADETPKADPVGPEAGDGPEETGDSADQSPAPAPEPEPEPATPPPRSDAAGPAPDDRVIVLHIVAGEGERLVGARLREALERNGLRHGAYNIFHAGDSEGSIVFSAANAVEPGTFDPATMDTLTTPGVALFMQVPGPQSAETVFDRMLAVARALADELDAHVLDERHSSLTRQTEQHLREELRLLDRRTASGQR